MNWISVKDRLPSFFQVVTIHYQGRVAFGGRVVYNDEGWLWGRCSDAVIRLDKIHDATWHYIEWDDDYEVTHWAEIVSPPEE